MNDAWDNLPETREAHCKCGWPDMPGQCPGWRSCAMCAPAPATCDDCGARVSDDGHSIDDRACFYCQA